MDTAVFLRLASGRRPYHGDGDAARMEKSARHGAVKLGRRHVLVLRDIMNTVDESRALAAVPWGVGRNLSSPDEIVRMAVQC